MKKILIALALLASASTCRADNFCTDWGKFNVCVPLANGVDTAYGYDFNGKQSQGLAETSVGVWNISSDSVIYFRFGGILSEFDKGSPFLGFDYSLKNPIAFLVNINPGIYGGKNWTDGSYFWGLKASIQFITPKQ